MRPSLRGKVLWKITNSLFWLWFFSQWWFSFAFRYFVVTFLTATLTRGRVWEAVCMIGTQLRLAPSPCRWTRKIRHWCHKSLKKYKKLKEDKLSVLQGKHTREHPAYLPWWSRWFGPSSLLSQTQTQTQPGQDQLGWQRFISQMRSLQISVHLSSLELTLAHLWSPVWGSQPIQTSPGSAWSRHPVCR